MTIEEASTGQRRPRGDPRRAAGGDRNGPCAQVGLDHHAPASQDHQSRRRLSRRRALPRAPRSALDRRQHLQGPRRQRARRPRGRVRRHRAREERLPARRRDRAAGRRGAAPRPRRRTRQPSDHRHAQARPGDRRPGRQGPAEDQGRAPVDGPDDRRALHGLRAVRRGRRRLAPARRRRARPAAQGGGQARPQGRRRDHPHRRAGRQARRPRARAGVPVQAQRGAAEAGRRDPRAGAGLPGGRPVGARRARHLQLGVRARDRRRSQAAPPPGLVLLAHRAGARRPGRAVGGADAAVRGVRRRGGARLDAVAAGRPAQRRLPDDRLRRGADGDRRQLRLVHRPRQGRAARGHDHQDQPRGRRRGRAPAAAARHRRDHRHRLHRHGPRSQPRRGAEVAAQVARRGPHEDVRGRDLAARAGRDDAPERHRRRARDHDPAVPDVPRRSA